MLSKHFWGYSTLSKHFQAKKVIFFPTHRLSKISALQSAVCLNVLRNKSAVEGLHREEAPETSAPLMFHNLWHMTVSGRFFLPTQTEKRSLDQVWYSTKSHLHLLPCLWKPSGAALCSFTLSNCGYLKCADNSLCASVGVCALLFSLENSLGVLWPTYNLGVSSCPLPAYTPTHTHTAGVHTSHACTHSNTNTKSYVSPTHRNWGRLCRRTYE